MGVYDNLNKTTSVGIAPSIQDYYDRKLLMNMDTDLVHALDGQKRTLPLNSGERIQFRKVEPFDLVDTPLAEGVTPEGQTLSMTDVFAKPEQYAGFVPITDKVQFVALDNWHKETVDALVRQAKETLDVVAREPLHKGTNVLYANNKTHRAALVAGDKLTALEIRKAVRLLEKNRANRFPDGFYHAVIGPDTHFDLQSDANFLDPAKYQDKSAIASGEVGALYGVKFFKSVYGKINSEPDYIYGTKATLTADSSSALNTTTKVLKLTDDDIDADAAEALVGKLVVLDSAGTPFTTSITAATPYVAADGENPAVLATIKLAALPAAAAATTFDGKYVSPFGGGKAGIDTASTIIYGVEAYGTVSLGNVGQNIQTIINPPGSSGSEDPAAQRGTIAWKVNGFTQLILQDAFIVRVEHGFSS